MRTIAATCNQRHPIRFRKVGVAEPKIDERAHAERGTETELDTSRPPARPYGENAIQGKKPISIATRDFPNHTPVRTTRDAYMASGGGSVSPSGLALLRVQLHSKQNPNKERTINNLSHQPVPNQRIFRKNVKFSTTQTLEMFNFKQPKPDPQVAPMVRVSKNHNLLIDHFARFVTT
jgi:hypothetical protein